MLETAGLKTEQVNTLSLLFTGEADRVPFVLCSGFIHIACVCVCVCTHCPRVSAAGWVCYGGRLQVL